MTLLQLIVLALVQGITEFLPISSSAHLILASDVAGWPDQGHTFDMAVHAGTLLAVLIYFRTDLALMMRGLVSRHEAAGRRLAVWLILASLPLGLVGLLAGSWIAEHLRRVDVIAWATVVFALVLALAWWQRRAGDEVSELGWRRALLIGLAQVLALIPGTSRSGITLSAGLLLGLSPVASARFAFLMAIPAIAMVAVYGAWQVHAERAALDWSVFGLAALLACGAALACIHLFLKLIERIGMWPFVIYRLLLGAALLLIAA